MLKITVTNDVNECKVKGNFQDICVETVIALRTLIESIEEADIVTIALVNKDEVNEFVKIIRECRRGNET